MQCVKATSIALLLLMPATSIAHWPSQAREAAPGRVEYETDCWRFLQSGGGTGANPTSTEGPSPIALCFAFPVSTDSEPSTEVGIPYSVERAMMADRFNFAR